MTDKNKEGGHEEVKRTRSLSSSNSSILTYMMDLRRRAGGGSGGRWRRTRPSYLVCLISSYVLTADPPIPV